MAAIPGADGFAGRQAALAALIGWEEMMAVALDTLALYRPESASICQGESLRSTAQTIEGRDVLSPRALPTPLEQGPLRYGRH